MGNFNSYQLIIVGAGLSGLAIAERAVKKYHQRVLVIDKREHLGGNCFSDLDPETGIDVHHYGPHIFHINSKQVWQWLQNFTKITPYRHRIHARYTFSDSHSEIFLLPINLQTINAFFRKSFTPAEAQRFIKTSIEAEASSFDSSAAPNLRAQGIRTLGRDLFNAFIAGYTERMWGVPTDQLPAHYLAAMPIRFDYNSDCYYEPYQGLPATSYSDLFTNLVDSIPGLQVQLSTSFDALDLSQFSGILVYTGPIDEFFGHSAGQLGWRSLRFETSVEPIPDYQGAAQINFSNREVPYQRICEYRHFKPAYADKLTKTVIVKEYPAPYDPTHGYDAFYPVNSPADQVKIEQYRRLARKLEQSSKIYFGGRLGTYRYLNMEQAIRSAWDLTDRIFSA